MDSQSIVAIATPVIVPLIVAGMKSISPKIPSWILPLACPLLGALVDIINHYATGSTMNLAVSAMLGLAGVGVREVIDQLKQPVTTA